MLKELPGNFCFKLLGNLGTNVNKYSNIFPECGFNYPIISYVLVIQVEVKYKIRNIL